MSADSKLAFSDISGDTNEPPIPKFGQTGAEIATIPINIVNASARKSSIDVLDPSTVYPEYVRSIKEKECWLLKKKMNDKGISVSYETILRGMLTPSEVRAVEKKQKEILERQASIELEAAFAADCDNNKK